MSIPCETCGAAADEPCAPDCPDMAAFHDSEVAQWSDTYEGDGTAVVGIDGEPAEWVPDEMDTTLLARQILFRAACNLPFAGLVSIDPPYFGEHTDEEVWLQEFAVWLARYATVATERADDLSNQARQRIGLQIEKDVLRGFLGEAITEKLEALQ